MIIVAHINLLKELYQSQKRQPQMQAQIMSIKSNF